MLGVEFLVKGVREYGEPGVFVAFEETKNELVVNSASLDFDLGKLVREGKLAIDHVHVDPNEIAETGEYDLEGLFIRLKYAIESVGAKRVVLDTIETLFSGFSNTALLRAEIRRLFQYLKSFGVTAIITGERGEGTLTRYGLEEYVADCVILLDHRVRDQITTRRLRIVKYRGSSHGTNEYPFIIDEQGFSVLPVTSMALHHKVSSQVISTGVPDLDAMLGVGGYYRGSTVLMSGTAGDGENQLRLCAWRGRRARAASASFTLRSRNRRSRSFVTCDRSASTCSPISTAGGCGLSRSGRFSMGSRCIWLRCTRKLNRFQPAVVVVDPISNLISAGTAREVRRCSCCSSTF